MIRKQKNKKRYSYNGDRDIFGTPRNRAKTWGTKTHDSKKNRKTVRNRIRKTIDELGI
tara:strand:- start:233 stop:406 length:174 start_codon:yes stop_codon:yes gene_type:complete